MSAATDRHVARHPHPDCPARYPSGSLDPDATLPICQCHHWSLPPNPGKMNARTAKVLFIFTAYVAGILSAVIALGNVFAFGLFVAAFVLFGGAVIVALRAPAEGE